MMNKEGPTVPVTIINNVLNSNDLLLELPLPTPLPAVAGHQSLLSHLEDPERIYHLLNNEESIPIQPLIDALRRAPTDCIVVKDEYYRKRPRGKKMSQLGQFLICSNPTLFKDSVHEPQSGNTPSEQRIERQCFYTPAHSEVRTKNGSVARICQLRQTQDNNFIYYPIDHNPTPLAERTVQNKFVSSSPESSSTYFPHRKVSQSGQHPVPPVHYKTVPERTGDFLPSGEQENSQIFNSPLVSQPIANVPSQSSDDVHTISDDSSVEEVYRTAVNTQQSDRSDNQIVNLDMLSNFVTNFSPLESFLNSPQNASVSGPSPLLPSAKHTNLSSDVGKPLVVLSKLSLDDQFLAQRNVHQFMIKSKKAGSSPDPLKVIVQNKMSKIDNLHYSSTCKELDSSNKYSRKKSRNEYFDNRESSKPIEDKELKSGANVSPEILSNVTHSARVEENRICCLASVESPKIKDVKENESDKNESPEKYAATSKRKKLKRKRYEKDNYMPLFHNPVFLKAGESLPTGTQNRFQLFNSPTGSQTIVNVPQQSPTVHTFSIDNSVDQANSTAVNTNQNYRAENLTQMINNVALSSSVTLKNPNEVSFSFPSLPSTSQHNSSSEVLETVSYMNCMKTPIKSVPNNSDGSSQPEIYAAKNKNSLYSMSESTLPPLTMLESVRKKCNEVFQLQKQDRNVNVHKHAVTPGNINKCLAEPIVVLSKLSLNEQYLVQKSATQFIIKDKRAGSSPEALKVLVQNKISNSSNFRGSYTQTNKERDSCSKSFKKGSRNEECFANHENTDYVKDKTLKKSLNASLKNLKSSSDCHRKWRRICPLANGTESSNSEDENCDEFCSNEYTDQSLATFKTKPLKIKKTKVDLAFKPLSIEDLKDSNTYQNFLRIVDAVFDSVEDIDFSAVIDDDAECPAEALIPFDQLQELSTEVAKLKSLQATNLFPTERLVRLLAILERNVIDGTKLLPVKVMEDQEDDERLCGEQTMQRVLRSADASLTGLYIMTSPQMPDKVFFEDMIERIVIFLKYQLQNTIFPQFDPAYRLDPKSKDGYSGSIKQKRARAHKVTEKSSLQLYNKLNEAVGLLAELLDVQTVTDTIILQVSTLGISPFFVEGIREIQLNALRLVTIIFARYDKHRSLILEDILASIARLPTSKRSLRCFRLNSEENIQMLTALVLQLIHSVIRLPDTEINPETELQSNKEKLKNSETKDKVCDDKDVSIITSYEAAMKTAIGFLSVFLMKCVKKNEEMDYKSLFENFIQDLLSTVNKPQWPASELLLSLLGKILVSNFSDKTTEKTLRISSLDYLGVVAARLRKDAFTSQERKDLIKDIIQRIVTENVEDLSPSEGKNMNKKKHVKQDEAQILQKALLQYLDSNSSNDPALQFSRKFYIAQWYRDAVMETKRLDKTLNCPKDESIKSHLVHNKSNKNLSSSSHADYEENKDEEEDNENIEESVLVSDELNAEILALAEKRKLFLLTEIKQQKPRKANIKEIKHIDYKTAELISQYLASTRHFSQSFDLYLSQILCVLSEPAMAIRTKAMKCLTLVVEADPGILARPDMQKGVHGRLLDQSISVREAAVDLLGKYILIRPELISQYFEMLTDRILDTGISVRKRVIKILKDICLEKPDFPQTPEICVKIIRRVNDEEGIRKLVAEVFQTMWFSPISGKNQERILQKVKNITHVVEACRDSGLEWFEQLLTNLLKDKEDGNYESVVKSCKQIVDCLVQNLLQLEESPQNVDGETSSNLVSCLATLHLFSKIHPPFAVPHAITIQPYLSMKCSTQADIVLLKNVVQTLELVVPLLEHPSESFLAQIEEDIVKLILRQHMGLLSSCVSCLSVVVNKVTHNYQLVKDCFQKFYAVLFMCKKKCEKSTENEQLKVIRPKLLRSLYTVGLFCRHFDFDTINAASGEKKKILFKDRIFNGVIYFNQLDDEEIRLKALTSLGFIMIRHYEFMLGSEVKTLYHFILTSPVASAVLKCQVLKNIANYLVEEETKMIKKDSEWSKISKSEDLKEIGDIASGMSSTVIQIYLNQILECVLHTEIAVRKACISVIQLILGQGLVHPVQITPYLVCLGSEDDPLIRTKADQLLQEIEKKYPGFILMKAICGVRMSFKMQNIIQDPNEILRGFRFPEDPVSRIGFLYSAIRSTRQNRRAFVMSLSKLFDEQAGTPLTELLYIADNISYFPYVTQDEPLFVLHQLDLILSVSGSNLLQQFCELLLDCQPSAENEQNSTASEVDDYSDDFEAILKRLPEDTKVLQESVIAFQGCILLLYVKQTLKEMYGFSDNKIQQYSPSEAAKVHERPLNRKVHVRFNPETVLSFLKTHKFDADLDDEGKENLVQEYLHFRQLMLTVDLSSDENEDNQTKFVTSAQTLPAVPNSTVSDESVTITPLLETKMTTYKNFKAAPDSLSRRETPKSPIKKVRRKRKRLVEPISDDSDFE